jgi:hypothetical protein
MPKITAAIDNNNARTTAVISAEMATLRASLLLDPPTFDADTATYTTLRVEYGKAREEEMKEATGGVKDKLAIGVEALVSELGIAEILGERVAAIRFDFLESKAPMGESPGRDAMIVVTLNPGLRAKPRITRSGTRRNLNGIFQANANSEERAKWAAIEAVSGEAGSAPDLKKFQKDTGNLKNNVADRVAEEQVGSMDSRNDA